MAEGHMEALQAAQGASKKWGPVAPHLCHYHASFLKHLAHLLHVVCCLNKLINKSCQVL